MKIVVLRDQGKRFQHIFTAGKQLDFIKMHQNRSLGASRFHVSALPVFQVPVRLPVSCWSWCCGGGLFLVLSWSLWRTCPSPPDCCCGMEIYGVKAQYCFYSCFLCEERCTCYSWGQTPNYWMQALIRVLPRWHLSSKALSDKRVLTGSSASTTSFGRL